MAFDSIQRRVYLQRLRDRALQRMREDERAAGLPEELERRTVSRRDSMRLLGMAAVGVAPVMAVLAKAKTAFAAEPMSARSAAPQYGAPSWYAPREPNAPVPVEGKVTYSRSELGDVKIWRGTWVQVASEKTKQGGMGFAGVEGKEGYYADGWGGGTHDLLAVADPDSNFAYILRAKQSFYAAVGGEMYGCMVGAGVFAMHASYCRSESDGDKKSADYGVAGVIAAFTKVSDSEASRRDSEKTNISLEKGIPQQFWVRNGYNGWEQNHIGIAQAKRKGDVLELTVRSENYQSEAVFTVDLKAQKLLKTEFEGKEWGA